MERKKERKGWRLVVSAMAEFRPTSMRLFLPPYKNKVLAEVHVLTRFGDWYTYISSSRMWQYGIEWPYR